MQNNMTQTGEGSNNNIWNKYGKRLIAGIILLLAFCLVAFLVETGRTLSLDYSVLHKILEFRSSVKSAFFTTITYTGNWQAIVAVMVLLALIPGTGKSVGIPASCCGIVSVTIYKILKLSFARPRPDLVYRLITEHGFSFPSGHSMNGMLCYGIIIFLLMRSFGDKKYVKVICAFLGLLIFIIGFSRMYCGVHYFSDVIGGWTAGLTELMFFSVALDAINEKLGDKGFMKGAHVDGSNKIN